MADAGGEVKWNGPQFETLLRRHLSRNISAASIALVNHLKLLITTEGAGERAAKGRLSRQSRKLLYGAHPSAPGEPPHKQTGRLLGSIAYEVSGLVARVGTNVKYGRWLELGTRRMAARPWLRRGLNEMRAVIARLICRPMP